MDLPEDLHPQSPSRWKILAQWAFLLPPSVALALLFDHLHLPAAFLLAPMLCGVVAGVCGATVQPPRLAFNCAQAILGVLIAASLTTDLFSSLLANWFLFGFVVLATILASSLAGYLISRWHIMPGTSGVWGSAPGAATAMVIMAEAFGADSRLVAFMQYLRVVIVTAVAALLARLFVDRSGAVEQVVPWFPPLVWPEFGATLLVAVIGGLVGNALRMPSPFFLGPMILGVVLEFAGWVAFQLPPWLLAGSYMVVGWAIGLRFTRPILRHVVRVLPQITTSILLLVVFCGGLASLLIAFADVDPLTAYLATSPGGMDSIAIIAAAAQNVNLSFVMGVQMLRFLIVLVFGPAIARGVARLVNRGGQS
ncbi:MAG TPA: AbrB family transcriptional regulator [Tianweitania sediminis]|jgi:hypothetical protein|nr:AbrB family transcriptional regulator [Tianweitania sediminis]